MRHARADLPPAPPRDLERLLSPEERERGARFRFERDRRRAVVAWGLLRLTLGELVGRDPGALRFVRNRYGKPHLPGGPSFNLSHSGEHILVAVAEQGRVGVDVEVVRPLDDLEDLAVRTFAADEGRAVTARPAGERPAAFFRTWTLKEAFVKALGGGLSVPLDAFSVSLREDGGHALVRSALPGEDPRGWSLVPLPCEPGAFAAVAWDRPFAPVRPLRS